MAGSFCSVPRHRSRERRRFGPVSGTRDAVDGFLTGSVLVQRNDPQLFLLLCNKGSTGKGIGGAGRRLGSLVQLNGCDRRGSRKHCCFPYWLTWARWASGHGVALVGKQGTNAPSPELGPSCKVETQECLDWGWGEASPFSFGGETGHNPLFQPQRQTAKQAANRKCFALFSIFLSN